MRKSCTETTGEKGSRKCSRRSTCWLWGWRPCKMKLEESVFSSGVCGKSNAALSFLFSQRLFKWPRHDGRSRCFRRGRHVCGRGHMYGPWPAVWDFIFLLMNRWRQQSIYGRFVIIDFRARDTYVEPSRLFIFLSIIEWIIVSVEVRWHLWLRLVHFFSFITVLI